MFGLLWMFATPIFMICVYTFIFSIVFKSRWGQNTGDSKAAFAMILFCGLVVYNIFAESLNTSVGVITSNPSYVRKVVFPLEVLPFAQVLTAVFFGVDWLGILFAGIAVLLGKVCITATCLPLILLPLFLFCSGLAWSVASLGVFFRDTSHVLAIILQALFFMTPIFYSAEMVPEPFRSVLAINPLTAFIQNVRQIMIFNQWPNWTLLGIASIVAIVVFQLGYFWFQKTRGGFADVI